MLCCGIVVRCCRMCRMFRRKDQACCLVISDRFCFVIVGRSLTIVRVMSSYRLVLPLDLRPRIVFVAVVRPGI